MTESVTFPGAAAKACATQKNAGTKKLNTFIP
jgi:hypothetical protein